MKTEMLYAGRCQAKDLTKEMQACYLASQPTPADQAQALALNARADRAIRSGSFWLLALLIASSCALHHQPAPAGDSTTEKAAPRGHQS